MRIIIFKIVLGTLIHESEKNGSKINNIIIYIIIIIIEQNLESNSVPPDCKLLDLSAQHYRVLNTVIIFIS